jgi:hypothetical protein
MRRVAPSHPARRLTAVLHASKPASGAAAFPESMDDSSEPFRGWPFPPGKERPHVGLYHRYTNAYIDAILMAWIHGQPCLLRR